MTVAPDVPNPIETPVVVGETYTSTVPAEHGAEHGGGLPQFEFEHWFGQIVYLIVLFVLLYWLIAKVFAPRLQRVIDQRRGTIADAIAAARQVQTEAAGQAEAAKAEVDQARAQARATAADAKARVTEAANARAAQEEAAVNARIAEAEGQIAKTRDAAMSNVAAIAANTAAAMVERLTGKAPTAAEKAV